MDLPAPTIHTTPDPEGRLTHQGEFTWMHADEIRPTSLTNRVKNVDQEVWDTTDGTDTGDSTEVRTDWGLDTVKLSFDVDPGQSWTSSPFWTLSRSRKRPEGAAEDDTYLGYLQSPTGEVRVTLYAQNKVCHLEFNAARLINGKSDALWTPSGLVPLAQMIIEAVSDHACPTFIRYDADGLVVWDPGWAQQVRVKRLDIARNFQITDPALVKKVLPTIACKHGRTKVEYSNSKSGWTLVNSTQRSGADRLYDKQAELANYGIDCSLAESEGTRFRFETQLQNDRLKTYGLTRLAQVAVDTSWKALEDRWEATRWGSPLPGSTGLLEALSGLSVLQMRKMLGDLHLDAVGLAQEVLTPAQLKEFRRNARQLGLTPGLPVELLGAASQYLDLSAGRLVPLQTLADAVA